MPKNTIDNEFWVLDLRLKLMCVFERELDGPKNTNVVDNEWQNWKNGQPVRNPFHHQQVQLNNGQLSGHVGDNRQTDKNIGAHPSNEPL